MSNIIFKEDTHEYFVSGVKYPSVTTVLDLVSDFSFVNSEVLERAQKFGTAVHKMTELYDLDALDLDSLDPLLMPYLEAWDKFLTDTGFKPLAIEERVFSRKGYAGTLDRYGMLNNKRTILDIKTGTTLPRSIGPQTAAYGEAYKEMGNYYQSRYAVQLKEKEYKIYEYKDCGDINIFYSCLNIYKWRNQ